MPARTRAKSGQARRASIFQTDLCTRVLAPWCFHLRDFFHLAMTSAACWRAMSETLEVLDFAGKPNISDADVKAAVNRFPNLRSMTFDMISTITDATIIFELPRLASLRELKLCYCYVTIAGLRALPPKLESLRLASRQFLSDDPERILSDEMLMTAVRRCTRLRSLDLSYGLCERSAITDAAIVEIATLAGTLKELDLSHSNVTDVALAHVVERCDLDFLGVDCCDNMTDVSIFAMLGHFAFATV